MIVAVAFLGGEDSTAQLVPTEGYVGSKACAPCHADNYKTQSGSGHAEALYPAREHPRAEEIFGAEEWVRPPESRFEFRVTEDGVRVAASHGERKADLPVEWAFGSGDHGVTFVSQLENERYIEYSFTWYSKSRGFALTAGHPDKSPASLTQAAGIIYDAFSVPATVTACFQCHSTGPVEMGDEFQIQPAELGVRCETCHGPGQEHVAAIQHGEVNQARTAIQNPGRMSAAEVNEFCGNCHRLPATAGRAFDFTNPWHVRHQPPYLSKSACFQQSEGALRCFTCHDPHDKLKTDAPQHYNAKCTSCHTDPAPHPSVGAASKALLTDCIACHMPKVSPQPNLTFTNHWIGVYGENEPLRPGVR